MVISSRSYKKRGRSRTRSNLRKDNYIYFDEGLVIDSLPGTMFKVEVERKTTPKRTPPPVRPSTPAGPSPENSTLSSTPGTEQILPATKNEEKEPALQPIIIVSNLKSLLIKKKILIIKGDKVLVEVNPEDMYFDDEKKFLKGTIILRK